MKINKVVQYNYYIALKYQNSLHRKLYNIIVKIIEDNLKRIGTMKSEF